MPKTIEKIIVKDGCDNKCDAPCGFEKFNSGDIAEIIFEGTFDECKARTEEISEGSTYKIDSMEHCYYSGGETSEDTYTLERGYLVKGLINPRKCCFIAKNNTDAFMSYEDVSPKTTEELIEEDKKTFRSGMLSHVIKKSPHKTE